MRVCRASVVLLVGRIVVAGAFGLTAALLARSAAGQQGPPPASSQPELPPASSQPELPPASGQPELPPASSQPGPPRAWGRPDWLPSTQQDRPVMLRLGSSVTWDSNVFRLPDSVNPQTPVGTSGNADRITTTYVGLRIDQAYARQRFVLDISETAYRYANFSYLDFDALQYQGAWVWQLGRRVSGSIAAERNQSLVRYTDFRDTSQRNVRTAENRLLSVDGWLSGGWHLVGGLRQQERKYSVPFPQEGSYQASGGEGGLLYLAPSGNSATYMLRSLDADVTDRALDPVALVDNGFKRSESELSALWAVTGKSTLEGRLARIDYRAKHFAQRGFSGNAARFEYRWAPSAKLTVNIGAARDLEPWTDSSASYRVGERLSLAPGWQLGPRTALRVTVERLTSDFRGPIASFAGAPRRDILRSAQLTLQWTVLRNFTVNATVMRYRQVSTDAAAAYEGGLATFGASIAF
jgi:exopolysaccharide biosynthesis operon protein EpsL